MNHFSFRSLSEHQTIAFGKDLATYLKPGDIICLFGNLGSGKTTLVKGIAQGLDIRPSRVNSPTFVLLCMYEGTVPLYHFDFYRLGTTTDIGTIGYDEFLYGNGVSVIEWAERFGKLMPQEHMRVELKIEGEHERAITVKAYGKRHTALLKRIRGTYALRSAA